MKKILIAVLLVFMAASATAFSFDSFKTQEKAALVQLSGSISTGSSSSVFSTGGISPSEVRNINERVEDAGYEAVIYEINSGGGTVVASKEVMREIESAEFETVCRFRDVAASGAYLFSLGCDRIVADSASLTGSVGVRSSFLEFSEAMEDYGVEYINITSGKYKEVGSQYVNASQKDKSILKEKSEKIHEQFLTLVEEKRNISSEDMEEIETGEIILGEKASELGMVDRLGGRETAKNVTEELTGEDLKFGELGTEEQFSLFSLLTMDVSLGDFFAESAAPITADIE
jgi:protease-4